MIAVHRLTLAKGCHDAEFYEFRLPRNSFAPPDLESHGPFPAPAGAEAPHGGEERWEAQHSPRREETETLPEAPRSAEAPRGIHGLPEESDAEAEGGGEEAAGEERDGRSSEEGEARKGDGSEGCLRR